MLLHLEDNKYLTSQNGIYISSDDYEDLKVLMGEMSRGGAQLGLPDTDPDLGHIPPQGVSIEFSEKSPKRREQLDITKLKKRLEELRSIVVDREDPMRWEIDRSIKKLEELIKKQGINEYLIYGEFIHKPGPVDFTDVMLPKVMLYLGNIFKENDPQSVLKATLVHELFHAWNYYRSGSKPRTIPEIDEAIVEYATLAFLDKIRKVTYAINKKYFGERFKPSFEWQLYSVRAKQHCFGLLPAYGFGEFIFNTDKNFEILATYPKLSGVLSVSDPDVIAARELLNPFYPNYQEAQTLNHIYKALNINNQFTMSRPISSGPSKPICGPGTSPSSLPVSQSCLFWDIINCPTAGKESNPSHPCHEVLAVQKPLNFRQLPEPWSGDLSASAFMVIGSNPALDVNPDPTTPSFVHPTNYEVFPAKDNLWSGPQTLNSSNCAPFTWSAADIEDYFVNRFNNAFFHPLGLPYFNKSQQKTLKFNCITGKIEAKPIPNKYWQTYDNYCQAISNNKQLPYGSYSFVTTDLVHCKSGKEKGVNNALSVCMPFTQRIIDLFIKNQQPYHAILLFCSDQKKAVVRFNIIDNALLNIGAITVGAPTIVCSYQYKRADVKNQNREILMQCYDYNGHPIEVYYQIPAPGGNTRCCMPVPFLGKTITW